MEERAGLPIDGVGVYVEGSEGGSACAMLNQDSGVPLKRSCPVRVQAAIGVRKRKGSGQESVVTVGRAERETCIFSGWRSPGGKPNPCMNEVTSDVFE